LFLFIIFEIHFEMNTNATSFNPKAEAFVPQSSALKQTSTPFVPSNASFIPAMQSNQPPAPIAMQATSSHPAFYPNKTQGPQYGNQTMSFNDFQPVSQYPPSFPPPV
jgi:hypothetical protein